MAGDLTVIYANQAFWKYNSEVKGRRDFRSAYRGLRRTLANAEFIKAWNLTRDQDLKDSPDSKDSTDSKDLVDPDPEDEESKDPESEDSEEEQD